jgi:hypothetical protein
MLHSLVPIVVGLTLEVRLGLLLSIVGGRNGAFFFVGQQVTRRPKSWLAHRRIDCMVCVGKTCIILQVGVFIDALLYVLHLRQQERGRSRS